MYPGSSPIFWTRHRAVADGADAAARAEGLLQLAGERVERHAGGRRNGARRRRPCTSSSPSPSRGRARAGRACADSSAALSRNTTSLCFVDERVLAGVDRIGRRRRAAAPARPAGAVPEGTTDCGSAGVGGIGADAPVPGPLTVAGDGARVPRAGPEPRAARRPLATRRRRCRTAAPPRRARVRRRRSSARE